MNEADRQRILQEIAAYTQEYELPQAGDISARDIEDAKGCSRSTAFRIQRAMVKSGLYEFASVKLPGEHSPYRVVRRKQK